MNRGTEFNEAYLAPEMGLANALFQAHLIVAFDEAETEGRWQQVLRLALVLLYHVLPIHNCFDVLCDRCIGAYSRVRLSGRQRDVANSPIPFLSIKVTRSASVRYLGEVVVPSRHSQTEG
jgi:hypothetical protein